MNIRNTKNLKRKYKKMFPYKSGRPIFGISTGNQGVEEIKCDKCKKTIKNYEDQLKNTEKYIECTNCGSLIWKKDLK